MKGDEETMIKIILKELSEFNIANISSVIPIAVFICMVLVFMEKSINSSSIEILFMNKREKVWNEFFAILVIGTLFTVTNGFLIKFYFDQEGVLIILVIFCIFFLLFLKNLYVLKMILKCKKEIKPLISYYRQKLYESMLMSLFMLAILAILYIYANAEEHIWSYAIIGGLVEVSIVILINPYNGGTYTSNYCIKDNEKLYIYKNMAVRGFLCGDTPEINNATWYKFVGAEEIQNEKIYREVYHPLSKREKKKLKKIYKDDLKQRRDFWLKGNKALSKVAKCFKMKK